MPFYSMHVFRVILFVVFFYQCFGLNSDEDDLRNELKVDCSDTTKPKFWDRCYNLLFDLYYLFQIW